MGGVLGIAGVVVGLFGERWVRTRGKVQCDIRWRNGKDTPDKLAGLEVQERQLEATFLNYKDVPVTVWDLRVEFYKRGKLLDAQEHSDLHFSTPRGGSRPSFELVTLHPRIPASRTVHVSPGYNEPFRERAAEEANRIEFVAVIEGANDIRKRLARWNEAED